MMNELENHMVLDSCWDQDGYENPFDSIRREYDEYERREGLYDSYKDELE